MRLAIVADTRRREDRDRGAVLILVLVVAIALSLVVLALANFVAADLRYAQVVDARAKRLASAESGIEYAVDRLRLNQTLCATKAASVGPVSLNGSNLNPVGTALPQPLNATTTKVTCKRVDGTIADVAGWAVVLLNSVGTPPIDQLLVALDDTVIINGPVFVPDAVQTTTDDDSRLGVVDGDVWYTLADCNTPYSNTVLAVQDIDVLTPSARGGLCTPRNSGSVFTGPTPENLSGLPINPAPDDLTYPGCRVFSPGRYTTVPVFTANVYFKSGAYNMDFNVESVVQNSVVWAGRRDPLAAPPLIPNGPCQAASDADTANGTGATFYFDRDSRLRIESNGRLEMFPRRQGNYGVSIQALPTSTTSASPSLVRTRPSGGSTIDFIVHGLVWAPDGRISFDNGSIGSRQMLLGGIAARRLWFENIYPPDFEIRPASSTGDPTSAGDTTILLTSTSTLDGASTTVEAVVAYRPHATDLDERVAVSSFRVVD